MTAIIVATVNSKVMRFMRCPIPICGQDAKTRRPNVLADYFTIS